MRDATIAAMDKACEYAGVPEQASIKVVLGAFGGAPWKVKKNLHVSTF